MPHTFVILGASGDLTHRKLVPALYHLFRKGRLPKDTRIVGFSRTAFTHDQWRSDLARQSPGSSGTISTPRSGTGVLRMSTITPATSVAATTSQPSPACFAKSK